MSVFSLWCFEYASRQYVHIVLSQGGEKSMKIYHESVVKHQWVDGVDLFCAALMTYVVEIYSFIDNFYLSHSKIQNTNCSYTLHNILFMKNKKI